MNKKELMNVAAKKADMSQAQMAKAVEPFIATIKELLAEGEPIQIIGFGSFAVKERPAHKGFNPATRKPIKIKAKKVVKFTPSKTIKLK